MRRSVVVVLAVAACAPKAPEESLAAAAKGVDLPHVTHPGPAPPLDPRYVVLAKGELRIAGDPFPVARLPEDAAHGFALEDKAAARDDRLLLPLDEALAWRAASAVVLVADARTPYRAAVEVLTTATHAKATMLAFAARDGKRVVFVPIELPTKGWAEPSPVGVWIAKRGVSMRLGIETLAPACETRGEEPTFPGALDAKTLGECAARLVRGHDRLAERAAFVGADSDAPLGDVVAAMDVLRGAGFGHVGLDTSRADAFFPHQRGALK